VHLVRVGIGLFDLSKDDRTCDVSLLCLDTGESGCPFCKDGSVLETKLRVTFACPLRLLFPVIADVARIPSRGT
jgi:hypothetical protein